MTIYQRLEELGLPIVYGRHTKKIKAPYLVLNGAGQDHFEADTTYYVSKDLWTVEYYFTKKDPELEEKIQSLLLEMGRRYDKSEDLYLDDQEVFMIYYNF